MTIRFRTLLQLMIGAWIAALGIQIFGPENMHVIPQVAFMSGMLLGFYLLKKCGFLEGSA